MRLSALLGLEAVLDMTLAQFDAACKLYERTKKQDLMDLATTLRLAAHAEKKPWAEFIKSLEPKDEKRNDFAAFMSRYGKGF